MTDPALQVDQLEVDFPTKDGVVHAVRGISFSVASREVLGIVGESGSGKSVTALAAMGLLPKSAQIRGSIRFRGREVLGLKEKQLTGVRGTGIAMIFQDPMTSLNPVYTIGWQIVEAIRAHQDLNKEKAEALAIELLKMVGIPNPAERINNYPHEFSGGMRQRAVIAIAMANDPEVILADEPTTALDVTVQAQVLVLLEDGAGPDERRFVADHPRPRGDRRPGRPGPGHVRRAPGGDRYGGRRLLQALDALHPGPARLAPPPRQRRDRTAAPDPGRAALHDGRPLGCPFAPRCPLSTELCESVEPDLTVVPSVTSATGRAHGGLPLCRGGRAWGPRPGVLRRPDRQYGAMTISDIETTNGSGLRGD